MNQEVFIDRLISLRKRDQLSLQSLGAAIGATKGTIGNLEHGNKRPSLDMVLALADYFNVSLDYLVGRSDDPALH